MLKTIGLAALMLATGLACAQDARMGTVKTTSGAVTLTSANASRAASTGGGVQAADRITTGAGASATMTLKDGTVLTVGPNTTLELSKLQFDTTTQNGNMALNLLQGTVRMVTGWLGKMHPEQVQIITPTSVVGVRGTDFIVEVP